AERPVVAEVAARWEGARQHVGDGLDAAVGMPGEAGAIVVGPVIAEIVEEQERIELVGIAEAEGAPQLDAGALHGGLRLDDALHGPDRHGVLLQQAAYVGTARRNVQGQRRARLHYRHAYGPGWCRNGAFGPAMTGGGTGAKPEL